MTVASRDLHARQPGTKGQRHSRIACSRLDLSHCWTAWRRNRYSSPGRIRSYSLLPVCLVSVALWLKYIRSCMLSGGQRDRGWPINCPQLLGMSFGQFHADYWPFLVGCAPGRSAMSDRMQFSHQLPRLVDRDNSKNDGAYMIDGTRYADFRNENFTACVCRMYGSVLYVPVYNAS
jgi:hypothetical protein